MIVDGKGIIDADHLNNNNDKIENYILVDFACISIQGHALDAYKVLLLPWL